MKKTILGMLAAGAALLAANSLLVIVAAIGVITVLIFLVRLTGLLS